MSAFSHDGFNCDDTLPRLQDFVDGAYGPTEERRMREHLASCESCRSEERELRRLLTLVAELPRSVEPSRDLWAGVAARLPARDSATQTDASSAAHVQLAPDSSSNHWSRQPRSRQPRSRQPWSHQYLAQQAAAAIVFMVLGAGLSRAFLPSVSPDMSGGFNGDIRAAAVRSADFAAVEAEYLRAKDALWLMVQSRREILSPVKLEIVQSNLMIVDEAIRDLREALADDPGNQLLEHRLLAQHRRSVDLLQRLAET